MKNFKKIMASCSTIAALMSMSAALAVDGSGFTPGDGNKTAITEAVGQILGVIQVVGVIVAIVMVMYVGLKYLTSGAGKKAEAKETMVPVLIGAVCIALAPTIVTWIFGAFTA